MKCPTCEGSAEIFEARRTGWYLALRWPNGLEQFIGGEAKLHAEILTNWLRAHVDAALAERDKQPGQRDYVAEIGRIIDERAELAEKVLQAVEMLEPGYSFEVDVQAAWLCGILSPRTKLSEVTKALSAVEALLKFREIKLGGIA